LEVKGLGLGFGFLGLRVKGLGFKVSNLRFKIRVRGLSVQEIIKVAMEVAKECGGLPLAIVPLASVLRGKTLNGRKLAYHEISSSRLMDIEDAPRQKKMHTWALR
ncbi:hypothetical protein Golax_008978, partial [Gossypium laxum]|nr:hypothetical protein [Gossypium laxum]